MAEAEAEELELPEPEPRDDEYGPLPLLDAPGAPDLCPFCFQPVPPGADPEDDPSDLVVADRGAWREWRSGDGLKDGRLSHGECLRLWRERMAARRIERPA